MLKLHTSPAFLAILQTVNLNILVFGLGCIFGMTGATLIDLGDIYQTSPKIVSYIITTRGMGAIVTCLLAGTIFKYFNMQHVVIISLLVMAIGIGGTPLWGSLPLCHIITFLFGGGIGLVESATNFWLVAIWKEKTGPHMQFINFCFGFGGLVSPFIAAPFLSTVHEPMNVTISNSSDLEILPYTADTQVFIPYLIVGGVFALVGVMSIAAYLMNRSNICVSEEEANDSSGTRTWQLIMISTFCIYILTIVVQEQTYISMLALFVVEQLNFTKSDSVYVSAVFWIFFTLSRVVATIVSFRMSLSSMLISCHVIVLSAAAVLCLFVNSATEIVWICSALMGFGISPMFATAFTHTVQYVHMTQTYSAFSMLCVCMAGMLPPVLVGPFIEDTPIAFVYINFMIAVISAGFLIALFVLPRGKSTRPSMTKKVISK